jgi:hypothetical protein
VAQQYRQVSNLKRQQVRGIKAKGTRRAANCDDGNTTVDRTALKSAVSTAASRE